MKTKLFLFLFLILLIYQVKAQKKDTVKTLNEVTVKGEKLKEESLTGEYKQPEWTTERRFSTTRVYLQQTPWSCGVEQWVKSQFFNQEEPEYLFQDEFELGLPGRFQFDIYENWGTCSENNIIHENIALELRWAFAKWGKIPLNPTLYLEWKFNNPDLGKDFYELKLLCGQELAPRWHWGLNLYYEKETGGELTRELGLSQGFSYTVKDKVLSLGAEMKVESETVKDFRTPVPVEVDLGPSLQWRPSHNTHFDVVPLIGLTKDSPQVEAWFIFGIDFGKSSEKNWQKPVSTQSH
jgi:hypothetical protein